MSTRRFSGVLVAATLLWIACSNATESAPSRTVNPSGDAGGASGTTSNGGPIDGGGDGYVDPGCLGPDHCYQCEAKESLQLLNACTEGQCAPFDNAARLPLYQAGKPLPAIP